MGAKLNLIGQVFGRLTVISESDKIGEKITWLCQCSCGGFTICTTHNLRRDHVKSCGCLTHDNELRFTHRDSRSREYGIWVAMKKRCYNPATEGYKNYHDRGIAVCDRWLHSYENFLEDMGRRPNSKMTLDRTNNDGNYSPENCRWATREQQANNTRACRLVEYRGSKRNMKTWSTMYHMRYGTLANRLNTLKWDIEKALLTPVKTPVKTK